MTTDGNATRTEVSCDTHGPMHYRFALDCWECVGFDGEGCSAQRVNSEGVFGCDRDPGIPGVTVRYRSAE